MQRVASGPKVARQLKFCGPWNGPDFEESGNLPWVASELSNPQI